MFDTCADLEVRQNHRRSIKPLLCHFPIIAKYVIFRAVHLDPRLNCFVVFLEHIRLNKISLSFREHFLLVYLFTVVNVYPSFSISINCHQFSFPARISKNHSHWISNNSLYIDIVSESNQIDSLQKRAGWPYQWRCCLYQWLAIFTTKSFTGGQLASKSCMRRNESK